uniref:Uncharacterized protein n=1 Tax=Fibrocapsa japonica TaxID=94617 RepID=A0A7S2UXY0_9STRA
MEEEELEVFKALGMPIPISELADKIKQEEKEMEYEEKEMGEEERKQAAFVEGSVPSGGVQKTSFFQMKASGMSSNKESDIIPRPSGKQNSEDPDYVTSTPFSWSKSMGGVSRLVLFLGCIVAVIVVTSLRRPSDERYMLL